MDAVYTVGIGLIFGFFAYKVVGFIYDVTQKDDPQCNSEEERE
jgi:hypothetical protein